MGMKWIARGLWVFFTLASPAGWAFAAECAPIEDVEKVLDRKIIFVGELHGTNESPRFVASLVCALLKRGGEVILALEVPVDYQSDIDAAMKEPDAVAAAARLQRMAFWDAKMQDGRRSTGWLELLESAARLKREYPGLGFVAIDAPVGVRVADIDGHMAERIREAAQANPKATIVALAGNLHARRQPGTPWNKDFKGAAYRLRDLDMIALNVHFSAGTAWNCTREGCGVNPVSRETPTGRKQVPRIELTPGDEPYDGKYELGEVTAALPVRGVPASPATAAPR